VSSISPWEKQDSGNNTGSKFLQLQIGEFTFSPSDNAGYEGFIGLHHRSGIFWLDQRCYGRIELLHGGTALSGRLSSRLPTRFYRPRNDFFGRVPLRHHDWYRRNIFRRLIDISLPKDLQRVELTWQKVSDSAVARICNTRESVEFGECKKFFKFERNVWFRAVLFA
jgi:hypothetical protein